MVETLGIVFRPETGEWGEEKVNFVLYNNKTNGASGDGNRSIGVFRIHSVANLC